MNEQLALFSDAGSDPTWCAYFAGLLDGEGCLTLANMTKRQNTTIHPRIYIAMTLPSPPIDACHERYGGSIARPRRAATNHRWIVQWCLSGRQCIPALTDALPYLRLKRRQAELVLEVARGLKSVGGSRWGERILTHMDYQARLEALQEIRHLNKRGLTDVRHTPAPIGAQQAHVRPGEWDMRQRGGAPLKGRTPPLSDAHSQPLSLGHNNRDAQQRT